jgi:hypothetical protein
MWVGGVWCTGDLDLVVAMMSVRLEKILVVGIKREVGHV